MRENLLRDYFTGTASAAELSRDLERSLVQTSATVTRHPIVDMVGEFEVRPEHLVRLCDAVLAGHIEPWKLEPIGFCLIASDTFWWDGDTPDGERVAAAAYDWSSPEINYPLTPGTVAKFRHRLLTDETTFTRADTRSA